MGEAICRLFAKEGAKVVVADYNFEGAEKVASEINTETPDAATAIKTDVSIETDINAMIDTAITFFGKVDILINNAGIMDGFEPVGEVTNARWDRVFAVNVNGPMYASRKVIQYILEQGHGNIINIASIGVGMAINPAFGMPEQIASVALFLASDDASFVNGAIVTADGGWTSY